MCRWRTCILLALLVRPATSFAPITDKHGPSTSKHLASSLHAKKPGKQKKKTKGRSGSTSGFGGAAVAPCPCGEEGQTYAKCCRPLHKDPKAFAKATPRQIVLARYSAYAKREVDFIVGSTHPLNEKFQSDIEHWKEQIKINCYDNFELTKCEILDESFEGEGDKEVAKVKFVASMTQVDSREKTAFMEMSTFERAGKNIAGGAWLYKGGVIEAAPGMPEPKPEGDEEGDESEGMEEIREEAAASP